MVSTRAKGAILTLLAGMQLKVTVVLGIYDGVISKRGNSINGRVRDRAVVIHCE